MPVGSCEKNGMRPRPLVLCLSIQDLAVILDHKGKMVRSNKCTSVLLKDKKGECRHTSRHFKIGEMAR